jgi:16S rRNA (cytidine1402-2'-O)-methyltransferase
MGTLYLVATPIGNLEDVTLRALRVLREADRVLAEDTRRTRVLLERHGIATRPRSLHAHNEAARTREVLEALAGGAAVALVSDAGTPLVSDPGAALVAAAVAAGHAVVPVPGASAVLSALTVSGLPAARFTFLGFLPRKAGPRDALLARHRASPETLVVFESPRRLGATLRALEAALGDRRACVARELTKLHEEAVRGRLSELAERFPTAARGEVTLVVEGAPEAAAADTEARRSEPAPAAAAPPEEQLEASIRRLLAEGRTPREVASALAKASGLRKREVYARAVAARGGA